MLRTVYAPQVTVSNTTGCVTEVDVSASSTECIGLTLGPAALKVLPIVTQATMMPSWAITGASTSVLDIPALTQATIDVTPLGDPLKIGLVPVTLAIPFSNEKPVDNLNISNPDHIALLEACYGTEAVEWANILSESIEDDKWYIGTRVMAHLSTDAAGFLNQLGPRMAEFATPAHLHAMGPTLAPVHFTSSSDAARYAELLSRMGGQAPPAGPVVLPGGPSVPPSPSTLLIDDASTVKERTLLLNADAKRRLMFCVRAIDEKNKTVSITGFAKENAAMTSVLATCKTAAERSDNIAAMWSTNARKNRADKAYKMHSEVQMRDNEHYDPTLAAMFIAHTFTTQPIQESVSSSASLCIYGWKKNGKEEVEAFKTEIARQTMELLHGQSDSNKTKIRTTVNARNCVSDLDEASHIAANFRGCLEALFQCKKDDESPIVYQLAGVAFEFSIDRKTTEWAKRHNLMKLAHKVIHSLDCAIAAAAAMSNDFGNKMASKNNIITDIDSTECVLACEKFLHTIADMKKKRDYDLPDNNYPLWLEKLYSKETASPEDGKPTGPLSPSKRTHGGSMVSFAKQLPTTADGVTLPAVGTQRGQTTGTGLNDWFNTKGGGKREGGGGEVRRKNMNGCYLYLPKTDTPDEALCPEVRAVQCARHAVAAYSCDLTNDKKCPHGLNHEWFHQYPEELKAKQLDYMNRNQNLVKFNPRAFATVRVLPGDMKHLVASNTPKSGEN